MLFIHHQQSQSKGVHVTTSRGVHLDSFEMSTGEVPRYHNEVSTQVSKVIDIHNTNTATHDSKKALDDGLSLHDSLSDVEEGRIVNSPRTGSNVGRSGAERRVDWRGMI